MQRSAYRHLETQHEHGQSGNFHSGTVIPFINNLRALLDPTEVMSAASGSKGKQRRAVSTPHDPGRQESTPAESAAGGREGGVPPAAAANYPSPVPAGQPPTPLALRGPHGKMRPGVDTYVFGGENRKEQEGILWGVGGSWTHVPSSPQKTPSAPSGDPRRFSAVTQGLSGAGRPCS